MPRTKCGFDSGPQGSGQHLLAYWGPTLQVNIGFDPNYRVQTPAIIPVAGIEGVHALVDTGAGMSCIGSSCQLFDQQTIGGVGGAHIVNIHLAQIHVPSLVFTVYGAFAGVHLQAAGMQHRALIGRTFLQHFTMIYEGRTGTVHIHNE